MKLDLIFKEFPSFYQWTLDKKLNETDLSILTEFHQLSEIKDLIVWIEKHFVSHSQGVQILDLAGELLLMNKNIKPVLEKNPEQLIKKLREMRFPESFLREKRKREILEKLGGSIHTQWVREKDRTGVQIQFKSFSPQDLKQKIEKLKELYKKKELWENNTE